MQRRLTFLIFALGACTTNSAAVPFEPDAVVTGIYRLDITSPANDCDPPRYTGTSTVALSHVAPSLSIWDVDQTTTQTVALTEADSYSLRNPATGQRINPCADDSASARVFTYTLTGASSDHVTVDVDETWLIVNACSIDNSPGAIPKSSCAATRTLDYHLLTPCAAPCVVKLAGATNAPSCVCS